MSDNYWNYFLYKRVSRRRALAATGGTAAAAAFLAACGGGGTTTPQPTREPGAVSDPTQGKQGGKLIWQGYGDPGGGLELIKIRNAGVHQLAGLTHDGLLEFAYGQPAYPGIGVEVLPILAEALPEISPDKLTITFKMRQGVKFHNGRELTSEDAKWTYDTALTDESAWRNDFPFIESTETPDPHTFVLKAKYPYADILQSMAQKNYGAIMAREHQESPDAERFHMGTGPYRMVEYEPPLLTRYQRNAEYHLSPYPYFEEIDRLGTSDTEKRIADFTSRQTHVTYWLAKEARERVQRARPDAQMFMYPRAGSATVYIRNDVAPYNDVRVRRALSMGIDRRALIAGVMDGEGEPDQALSHSATNWGFRKPSEMGEAAKYWEYNVEEAKKLLSAAGVSLPLRTDIPTWNATVIGPSHVDEITLITTQWRNNGILDANLLEETFGQFAPRFTGNYDTLHWGPNVTATLPDVGIAVRNKYFSPPGGVTAPTLNISYVNIPRLSELVEEQLGTFDIEARKGLFKEIEQILADEMVHVVGVQGTLTWFVDQSISNAQMPRDAYNGATPWMKYWWFT